MFFAASPTSGESPVPFVKFRGNVFHAVCKTGPLPEREHRAGSLYDLLAMHRKRIAAVSVAGGEPTPPSSGTEGAGTSDPTHESDLLTCPVCGQIRQLEISFPGVFGKEKAIGEAIRGLFIV